MIWQSSLGLGPGRQAQATWLWLLQHADTQAHGGAHAAGVQGAGAAALCTSIESGRRARVRWRTGLSCPHDKLSRCSPSADASTWLRQQFAPLPCLHHCPCPGELRCSFHMLPCILSQIPTSRGLPGPIWECVQPSNSRPQACQSTHPPRTPLRTHAVIAHMNATSYRHHYKLLTGVPSRVHLSIHTLRGGQAHLQRAHLHLSAHQVLREHALVQDACTNTPPPVSAVRGTPKACTYMTGSG